MYIHGYIRRSGVLCVYIRPSLEASCVLEHGSCRHTQGQAVLRTTWHAEQVTHVNRSLQRTSPCIYDGRSGRGGGAGGGAVSVTATVTVTLLLEPGAVNVLCSLHVTSVTCRLPLLLVILVVATSRPDSTRACLCRNPLYELLLKDVFPACLRQRLLPAGGRHGPSRNSSKDHVDFALNFTVLEYDFVSLLKQPLVSLQYFLSITGLVVATENLVGYVKNIVQTDGIHLSSACSNLNVKDRSITDRFP